MTADSGINFPTKEQFDEFMRRAPESLPEQQASRIHRTGKNPEVNFIRVAPTTILEKLEKKNET